VLLLAKAVVMGVVEGVTEFLPVSSTGHLILVGSWLDYPEPQRVTMEIFIQMGAILAVFWQYGAELLGLARRLPRDDSARALVGKILLAFVPAAAVGFLVHHAIEERLFNPASVATALIVGGIVILVVEWWRPRADVERIERTGWGDAAAVGVAQVTSLVPGVSRAGATIVGGLLTGLSRPVATQFSFYLALPTVCAASLFSLVKGLPLLGRADVAPLALGFVAAFASALVVIRSFLVFVRSHDFRVFGWYRIALSVLVYALLR
jgi:undecaprenyl-diphosphatase